MRQLFFLASSLSAIALFAAGGCGSFDEAASDSGGEYGGNVPEPPAGGTTDVGGSGQVPQGATEDFNDSVLAAGDWDDNLNFSWYLQYRDAIEGFFAVESLPVKGRVLIEVSNGVEPIGNATVSIIRNGMPIFATLTGSDGRAMLLPDDDAITPEPTDTVEVYAPGGVALMSYPLPAGDSWAFELANAPKTPIDTMQVAVVVDATGSMGDEIDYLTNHVTTIDGQLTAAYPTVDFEYALIAYRDEDTEVDPFPLDAAALEAALANTKADGGGDYPEAFDAALKELAGLNWSGDGVGHMAFVVGDAPPHTVDFGAALNHMRQLRSDGIRVYPIGSSGTGDIAEYYFRQTAQLTLGRYLFLTKNTDGEDSVPVSAGLGEPGHIPCFFIQDLQDVMTRAITSELLGQWQRANYDTSLDAVGAPDETTGLCTFGDGTTASL
jgi:hypothetical protein